LEQAVFDKWSNTEILLLSEQEKDFFTNYYGTAEDRFHLLPPGIAADRVIRDDVAHVRRELRSELSVESDQFIVLMVGSDFNRKGLDRAIRALASLPSALRDETVLLVVGKGKEKPFRRLAKRLGVVHKVRFVGGREDAPRFLVAADLLLHPAYREAAGMVLIEAMAAGLPVLATDVCGNSYHIERAGAGKLVHAPFKQESLDQLLRFMLTSDRKEQWGKNGRDYVAELDVFNLHQKAVDIIEEVTGC
jgi:UDP-glucose:(heptosyl)LPS alpha-1,3-glucosyltransferase